MTISQGMTYVLSAALVGLSVRGAFAPRAAALAFGMPVPEGAPPTPFLEVKANRDITLAGLLIVTASASHSILSSALFLGAFAPAADAFIVLRHGKRAALPIHLGTFVYLLVAGALAATGH